MFGASYSYVDDLLRKYIARIEQGFSTCDRFDLVEMAYSLMLRSSKVFAMMFREKLEVHFPTLDLAVLDAYSFDDWLTVLKTNCINAMFKTCREREDVDLCKDPMTGSRIENEVALLDRISPYCCRKLASVVIELADELGYARLAIAER